MPWLIELLKAIGLAVVIFTFLAVVAAMFGVYLERKISGWIQARLGPKHVGPQGLLQTIADTVKLLQKEHITPRHADALIFNVAPVIVAVAALLDWVVIPFGKLGDRVLVVRDINIGVLYFAAMSSVIVIGIIAGGWSSNNKYALLGGLRSASQMLSYGFQLGEYGEMFGMAAVATIMFFGGWTEPHLQPYMWLLVTLGCLVVAAVILTTGLRQTLLVRPILMLAGLGLLLSLVMFFGTRAGLSQVLPSLMWFLAKMFALVFFLMWMRWTYPRLRLDQLLTLSWKVLLPLGLLNLLAIGFVLTVWGR